MHPEVEALAAMLDEAVTLLSRNHATHWADWLAKDAMRIRRLDFYGIEHLLSAFGGMGSLNDLGFAQPSPGDPSRLVTSPDDERFQSLLGDIHALAVKLSQEERRATSRT